MKEIQKRMLIQTVVGFLLGRVLLFGRNPVGAAYFAAAFVQGGSVWPLGIAVSLGMVTALPVEAVLRYITAIIVVEVAADFLRRRHVQVKMGHCALIMAAILSVLSAVQFTLIPFQAKDLIFAAADVILVLVFSRIFSEGQGYLLRWGQAQINNEELISLIITGALAVYGLPAVIIGEVALPELVIFLLLPVVGYQYGAGAGAVAGAAGGVLLTLSGQDSEIIGMLCLLGISSGLLRRHGKMWMILTFAALAVGLGFIINEGMLPSGIWKAVLLDCGVLLVVPERYLRKHWFQSAGWEDGWSRNNFQSLMKYRLEDYSRSFQALSKAMCRDSKAKEGIDRRDMRRLMQEMSEEICDHCDHRQSCMGQMVLGRPETIGNLALAQEQGNLVLEQMPVEFTRECVHPQRFLMEANQSIRMARMILGFQNRMAQNRQVLAEQMEQVGELLEGLAEDMLHVSPVPSRQEEAVIRKLSAMNVAVQNLVFYEDREKHLVIHMQARTVRGRLITGKETAGVLSEILGRSIAVSQDSRNIIPRQATKMVFVEDTPFHAITGVARLPKEGEEVSGDTFSCLFLPNGELLLALSDGMGSGKAALEESQTVIELLEQMTEAGFSKLTAMKLINSLYISEEDNTRYATADVTVLNLYDATCQFVKNGAAATWIRHGQEAERVEGQSLPVGIMQEAEPYLGKCRISSGDYVIMMTDGVSDAFAGNEEAWKDFLIHCPAVNPQEMAEQILEEALECSNGVAADDMSVIVAGVWIRGGK